jgi:Xaa-Pro aminopeptidase
VLLIDLWAKVRDAEDAPYADSTWMAYTAATPPGDLVEAFAAARAGRDAAVAAVAAAARAGTPIAGRTVDRVARAAIEQAGLAAQLVHRTGHSLGSDHVHGMGTNLDDVEFPDDRPLVSWSGFTIEPGLYWPGRFGVRLEVSIILEPDGPRLTTESQSELTLMGAALR